MEVWTGKTDPEHAEDFRGTDTAQPVHHLDGAHQEALSGAEGGQVPGQDEVQKNNEG